jgi:hypothetical protein
MEAQSMAGHFDECVAERESAANPTCDDLVGDYNAVISNLATYRCSVDAASMRIGSLPGFLGQITCSPDPTLTTVLGGVETVRFMLRMTVLTALDGTRAPTAYVVPLDTFPTTTTIALSDLPGVGFDDVAKYIYWNVQAVPTDSSVRATIGSTLTMYNTAATSTTYDGSFGGPTSTTFWRAPAYAASDFTTTNAGFVFGILTSPSIMPQFSNLLPSPSVPAGAALEPTFTGQLSYLVQLNTAAISP